MPTAQDQPRFDPAVHRLSVVMALCIALATSSSGCAHGRYLARDIPEEWRAEPTSNVQTVNLTKLASDAVPTDQIARGDVLEISITAGLGAEDTVEFAARVNDRGEAILPHIGAVYLVGLRLEEAESAIKIACIQGRFYKNPHVTVTMKQRKEIEVTVVGAVEEEGTYRLRSGSSGLLQAISLAGGFSEDAGTQVEIRTPAPAADAPQGLIAQADAPPGGTGHGGVVQTGHDAPIRTSPLKSVRLDLASLSEEDPRNLELADGSVVMVERRDPPPIEVIGLVNKAGAYDFPVGSDLTVLGAISLAGGTSSLVADKVFVIRRRADQPEPALIEVSLRRAKRNGEENILLQPGDVVSVEQTSATVMLEVIRVLGFTFTGSAF